MGIILLTQSYAQSFSLFLLILFSIMPTFLGNEVKITGTMPQAGEIFPELSKTLTTVDLEEVSITDMKGRKVLNIFPSIDTPTCALAAKRFNKEASSLDNTTVLCISKDTPFAQKNFCGAEGLEDVKMLSAFRSRKFGRETGTHIDGGALDRILCRAIIVLDEGNKVLFSHMTQEISEEPDYAGALAALN